MNLTLATSIKFLLFFIWFSGSTLNAQDFDDLSQEKQDSIGASTTQKSAIFTFGMYKPFTTDNSAIGKGTEGKIGFKLGAQLFIYKRFFIGGFLGASFLDVTNAGLIGDYDRSRIVNGYLEVGYEFQLMEKLNLGLSIAPLGTADYRNYISSGRIDQQNDTASTMIYQAYVSYNFAGNFSFFIDYSFRNDHTKIRTAPEIRDDFDNIQYHNIGFGVKFALGRKAMIE